MYLVVQRTSLPLYQQAYKWSLNLKPARSPSMQRDTLPPPSQPAASHAIAPPRRAPP